MWSVIWHKWELEEWDYSPMWAPRPQRYHLLSSTMEECKAIGERDICVGGTWREDGLKAKVTYARLIPGYKRKCVYK